MEDEFLRKIDRKEKSKKVVKSFPARLNIENYYKFDGRRCFTFEDLYRAHKKNGRGLNPNPKSRGEENGYLTGKLKPKGFPIIELAMEHPQGLIDTFFILAASGNPIDIQRWVKNV